MKRGGRPEFVMCMTADRIPPVPAVSRPCGECATAVWISYRLVDLVDRRGGTPLCPECAADHAADSAVEFRVSPDQTDELAQLGVLGAADWLVTRMNRLQREKGTPGADPATGAAIRRLIREVTGSAGGVG